MTSFASYVYAGRADRMQEVLHAAKAYSFGLGRGGLAGNDDSGGESSWYVWACVGLFPLSGLPVVLIGLPSFRDVALRVGTLGARRTLIVRRRGRGRYVQNGSLDGAALCGRSWLWASDRRRRCRRAARSSCGWGPPPPRSGAACCLRALAVRPRPSATRPSRKRVRPLSARAAARRKPWPHSRSPLREQTRLPLRSPRCLPPQWRASWFWLQGLRSCAARKGGHCR